MARVHRLSESLTNQIAAGEVVERPASAAKELIENALDAGASRIDVQLEDGGRRRIEVIDDGGGMSREDALLALERHTTSKLRDAEQLFDIRTFGFRGEAIPSIASVSRFTLTTRQAEDEAATRITIEGGRILSVEDVGAPVGTRVEVADLFFNVPARLKFMKARATELGHVTEWVTRLALANPKVSFTVSEQGRVHLKADATGDLRERIAALLGRDLRDALYPVAETRDGIKVHGFAAGPQRANNTAREIYTFVNNRFVRDRGLLHGIARAYEGVLPIGRSPACVLFVDISPGLVDVNVHPQKLEVRFSDSRPVYDAVVRSIAQALSTSPWLKRAAEPSRSYTLRPADPALPLPTQSERIAQAMDRFAQRTGLDQLPVRAADSAPIEMPERPLPIAELPPLAPLVLPVTPTSTGIAFSSLRYLGQIHRTYLACESQDGLLLIDQHAGHERVLYERYRLARAGSAMRGQPFLVPLSIDFSPSDARLVEAALEELADLGFELEPFGGNTFALKAAPSELEGDDLARVVAELASELRNHGRATLAENLEEKLLARMACHTAVRVGHALESEEVMELLKSLDGTPFHAQCPHGRPVVVRFDSLQLKEMFGRDYEGTPRSAGRDRIAR